MCRRVEVSVVKKIAMQLAVGKSVELSGFNVSGSNTVQFNLRFVELGISVYHGLDLLSYLEWKKANPVGTWREYVAPLLLDLYNSFALAKALKDQLDEESVQ